MFRQWLHSIAERLPARCAICRSWPARPLCDVCVARFAQPVLRCPRCALPRIGAAEGPCGPCTLDPPPLDACIAAVPYDYPWSRLIIEFKFHGRPQWSSSLAPLIRHAPWAEPALEHADQVIPIPLSSDRLQERGFNQALELAKALAPGKVLANGLMRIRDTTAQSRLTRAERIRNLGMAFAVPPEHVARIRGGRVVLVDDVMTTGATLHAAARCVRAAGASHITALVLARAEPPPWQQGPL